MIGKLRVALLLAFVLLPLIVSATSSSSSSSASSSSASSSSSSSSSGGGGHGPWYTVPQQQTLLECIIYACVTCLALIFEMIHHRDSHTLEHAAEHAFLKDLYGQNLEEKGNYRKGKVMGFSSHLYQLWQRFSSELMVLGFISFLAWALEQGEAFKDVTSSLSFDNGADLLYADQYRPEP